MQVPQERKERRRDKFGKEQAELYARCSNCQHSMPIQPKATEETCDMCGMRYRISWVNSKQPRIRGPVWSYIPPPGPWPPGWPGELDIEGHPVKRDKEGNIIKTEEPVSEGRPAKKRGRSANSRMDMDFDMG